MTGLANVPARFELFLLGDGEKKCSEVPDTRESFLRIVIERAHALGCLLLMTD